MITTSDHNKIELTREGRLVLEAVDLGLGHLNNVVSQIGGRTQNRKLSIACGFSFAVMWFLTRISRFRQLLDGSEIHLITSEYPEELDPETIDIRVLWKKQSWPDRDVRP